jgi:hypothetical protein
MNELYLSVSERLDKLPKKQGSDKVYRIYIKSLLYRLKQTLTTLELACNQIDQKRAQHLGNILRHNTVRLVFY